MNEPITRYLERCWASEKQIDFKTSIGMTYPPVGAITALRELAN